MTGELIQASIAPRLIRHGNPELREVDGFFFRASIAPRLIRHGNRFGGPTRLPAAVASIAPRLIRHGNWVGPDGQTAITRGFNCATPNKAWKLGQQREWPSGNDKLQLRHA